MKAGIGVKVLVLAVLASAIFAVYWPAREFEFIHYDDPIFITENAVIRGGLNLQNVKWALTNPVAGNWHPVTTLSHMLDCSLFGARPGSHHMMNVAIHTCNALLLFLLAYSWGASFFRSLLVAGIFALHPLRVESVAWVAQRKDLLCALFFFLSLLAYTSYCRGGKPAATRPAPATLVRQPKAWYALALGFFALGLMSKAMIVTLPLLLVVLDWWPLKRLDPERLGWNTLKPLLVEKLPFLMLSAAVSWITLVIQRSSDAMPIAGILPLASRFENAAVSCLFYLKKMAWPTDLALLYPHPAIGGGFSGKALPLMAVGVLAAVTAVSVWACRRKPYLLAGWLWFLGMLVPVIGLVQVGDQAMADRYTYLPGVGILFAVVWLIADTAGVRSQLLPWYGAAGAVILLVLALGTRKQLGYWENTVTLFTHTLANTRNNPTAHLTLGAGLQARGQVEAALEQFSSAAVFNPLGHYYAAQLLKSQGRWLEAEKQYQTLLSKQASHYQSHLGLSETLVKLGRTREGLEHLEIAFTLNAKSPEVLNNFAWLLATHPDPAFRNGPRAVAMAEQACLITQYRIPQMIGTLAASYAEAGRFDEAARTAKQAAETADKQGQTNLAALNRKLAENYLAQQPFREGQALSP